MSATERKHWLIAYDIRCPRRLMRVHRCLKREGATVQYSAFSVLANDIQIREVLAKLEERIDPSCDDVRAYHLPERCPIWALGQQCAPEGIVVTGELACAWMLQRGAVAIDETLASGGAAAVSRGFAGR